MSSAICTIDYDSFAHHRPLETVVELPAVHSPQLGVRLSAWRNALSADIGFVLDAGTGTVELSSSIDRHEAGLVHDDLIDVSKQVIAKRCIQFGNTLPAALVLKWFVAAPVYVNGRFAKVVGFGGYDQRDTPMPAEPIVMMETCAEWLGLHLLSTVAPERLLVNPSYVKLLLSATTEALFALDQHDRIVFMNAAAERMAETSLTHAYMEPVSRVIGLRDGDAELFIPDLAQLCRATGSPIILECRACPVKAGRWVQVEGKVLPVQGDSWQDLAAIVLLRDIEENIELQQQLIWQHSHDQLSGVKNRFELERLIAGVFKKQVKSSAVRASLVHVGVDGMGMINNSCGPAGGDELLKRVAAMIQDKAGTYAESVSRIGGDEFGILLDGMDLRRAARFASAIMQGMRGIFVWGGEEIDVSVSIGIVPLRRSMLSAEEVLLNSSVALRRAKEGGHGTAVIMRSIKESDYPSNDLQTIGMIRRALEEKRVVLLYQKIVPVDPLLNKERHNEIFVRLRSSTGTLIPPDSFIPVAERNQLMPQLDRAILMTVAENIKSFAPDEIIAVNISGKTISSAGIIDFIEEQFVRNAIDPKRICFEITETAALKNEQVAIDFACKMRALGCTISLDDFGAGHHNFVLLKTIEPEYVKIDGSFIRQMFAQDFNAQVIRSVVEMANTVHAKVVAESVEDQKTMDALKGLGVTFVQGWHVHRPEIVKGF